MANTNRANEAPTSNYRRSSATLLARKAARVTALFLAGVGVLALVAASPLALKSLGAVHGMNWVQLSYIGQTYGAASALLTGLALIGVAGSIILQTRAVNIGQAQSAREHHAHLIEMALNDPAYQRAWGRDPSRFTPDAFRQRGYLNLIVSHWQRDYRFNGFAEHALRHSLAALFRGEAARLWWADTGGARAASSENRRDTRFCRIVEEEYRTAVSSGPPQVPAQTQDSPDRASNRLASNGLLKAGVAVLLGAAGGAILGRLYRKV